jgi:hypothetical protein
MSKKSRQLGLKEVYVHMGTFDFAVYCIVGSYDSAAKYTAWKFEDKNYENFANDSNKGYEPRGKTFFKTGYVPVIWIPKRPETPRQIATLAHECLHAVYHMMDWASVPTIVETDEVICHAMSHLITTILGKLNVNNSK